MSKIDIRLARSDEAPAISALVLEVFEAIVAPYYGAEGRATFDHEAAPEAMAARLAAPLAEGRTAPHARSRRDRLKAYRLRMEQKAWPGVWPRDWPGWRCPTRWGSPPGSTRMPGRCGPHSPPGRGSSRSAR